MQECTEADGDERSQDMEEAMRSSLSLEGLTCNVDHGFHATNAAIERCDNAMIKEELEPFHDMTDQIYAEIWSGCASPPCNVDGRRVLGGDVYDDTMEDCRASGMDVWIDEFTVDQCTDEDENHVATNILWCVDPICNNAAFHEEWDDTDDLEEMYPECRVDMSFTINGESPSAGSLRATKEIVFHAMVAGTVMLLIASL